MTDTAADIARMLGGKIDPSQIVAVNGKPLGEFLKPPMTYDEAKRCIEALERGIDQGEGTPGSIRFTVEGPPMGKPRMTQADKWHKRKCTSKYWAWKAQVEHCVGSVPPASRIAALHWTAYFEPPKSWSKKKRAAAVGTTHRAKPDIDNVCKALLDALWPKDDSGIGECHCFKKWDLVSRLEVELVLTSSSP